MLDTDSQWGMYEEPRMTTFQEYENFTSETDTMGEGGCLVYPALGLVGESGEYADKVKKHWRNTGSMDASNLTPEQRVEFVKELGDVLWYLVSNARKLGFTLEQVVDINVKKLTDRRARGVTKGEGDNR